MSAGVPPHDRDDGVRHALVPIGNRRRFLAEHPDVLAQAGPILTETTHKTV